MTVYKAFQGGSIVEHRCLGRIKDLIEGGYHQEYLDQASPDWLVAAAIFLRNRVKEVKERINEHEELLSTASKALWEAGFSPKDGDFIPQIDAVQIGEYYLMADIDEANEWEDKTTEQLDCYKEDEITNYFPKIRICVDDEYLSEIIGEGVVKPVIEFGYDWFDRGEGYEEWKVHLELIMSGWKEELRSMGMKI